MHLAARCPLAGVMWQLLHHLIRFRQLGFEVYYIEDNGGEWLYDPYINAIAEDPTRNVRLLANALEAYGFKQDWAFLFDRTHRQHYGMERRRALELLSDADAVVNLCAATGPRDELAKYSLPDLSGD
jgi:hypothetical protein